MCIAMWLEGHKTLRRILVTFRTGFEAVVNVHLRRFVSQSFDFVVTVTLVTFCCVCIAQSADLAVISTQIRLQFFRMAVAAIPRNSKFGRRIARRFDVMRGMAIYTNGGIRIAVY